MARVNFLIEATSLLFQALSRLLWPNSQGLRPILVEPILVEVGSPDT
jgi:hypothetical protein